MMHVAQTSHKPSPGWITWLLLVGAVALFAWGWFVLGFLPEPSAVGGILVALWIIGGASMAAAVLGLVAAAGLIRGARWATTLARVAAAVMILSVVGAIMGIPALIGLFASRSSTSN
jgi:hypothetical protein